MPPMSFVGIVTKVGCMNKTATVTVSRFFLHKRTGKMLLNKKKLLTHDEMNILKVNDTVLIRNCPPISARKRFELEKILKSPETVSEQARLAREAKEMLEVSEEARLKEEPQPATS